MRNKLSYFIIGVLLFLVVGLIVGIPKLYFLSNDRSLNDHYTIRSLNLTNLYEDNSLSNDKKLELLTNPDTKLFSIEEKINGEEYVELIKKIRAELKRIDEDSLLMFDKLFYCNFEDLVEVMVTKGYFSNDNYDSFTLKQINYYTDQIEVQVLIDANDFTIFSFNGVSYLFADSNDQFEWIELTKDYKQYLELSKRDSNVFGYRTTYSIVLGAFDERNIRVNEIEGTPEIVK